MTYAPNPRYLHEFRDRTQKETMLGVSFHRFQCRKCGQNKPVLGRKSMGYKMGFKCADCAKEQ